MPRDSTQLVLGTNVGVSVPRGCKGALQGGIPQLCCVIRAVSSWLCNQCAPHAPHQNFNQPHGASVQTYLKNVTAARKGWTEKTYGWGHHWEHGWRCALQRFSRGRGDALKGLQLTASMPWRDCGPLVMHIRVGTPLKSYSPQMITASSGTFPKGLWLTENICQGRNFPKRWLPMQKPYWGRGKQEEKIGRRKTVGVQSQLPKLWLFCLWLVPEWNPVRSR